MMARTNRSIRAVTVRAAERAARTPTFIDSAHQRGHTVLGCSS